MRLPLAESLPPEGRRHLRSLALESQFASQPHLPCHGILSAWGTDELQARDFLFHPEGCGWHLDRAAFDALLLGAAEMAGACVFRDVRACRPEFESWSIRLQGSSDAGTRLLQVSYFLDTTGRAALIARAAGARRVIADRLMAVTALLHSPTRDDTDSRSLIEAASDGWWYSALLPQGRVVTFFTDSDQPALASARSASGWAAASQSTEHIRALIERHRYCIVAGPQVVPASSARLSTFGGREWIAAGDAALSYDPLSGRGIVAAMNSGSLAANALAAALSGDSGALKRYAQQLERDSSDYQSKLARYYSAERRWPDSPFWQRRRG